MTATSLDLSTRARPLYAALYAVAIAMLLPSLMEWLLVSFPYRFGTAQWRFGTVGMLFNSILGNPIIALVVGAFAALHLGHRGVLRAIAVVALVLAVCLAVAGPLFVLDFLQLRASVNPQMKRAFDFTTLKATLTGILMFVTTLVLGLAAWRSSSANPQARGAARPTATKPGPLVMGATSQG